MPNYLNSEATRLPLYPSKRKRLTSIEGMESLADEDLKDHFDIESTDQSQKRGMKHNAG